MLQTALPCHSVGGLLHLQAQEAIAQALEDWDPKSDSHAVVRLGTSAPPVCSQQLACLVSCILAAVRDCMQHQPQFVPLSGECLSGLLCLLRNPVLHELLPVLPLLCA